MDIQECFSKIVRKITNAAYLSTLHVNKQQLDQAIYSNEFMKNLSYILTYEDFSFDAISKLCYQILSITYTGEPVNNLKEYIYQYALNKSFPDAVSIELNKEMDPFCEIFLKIYKILSDCQIRSNDGSYQSRYPMVFLSPEEESSLESAEEYKKFVKVFRREYIYEMMKLNQEVYGYNTLDHVCGVHYIALFIARQFKELAVPVDLGRVSGAAAGHDIGKFGCKGAELKRVPYLHYYYSDLWFKKNSLPYIGNIAMNHSTWDLELENLSLESLILIYSDFRVKNKRENGKDSMHIFSLKESFDVILNKLDNVDEYKLNRYKRVYEKLKDFEEYMKNKGISTDINETAAAPLRKSSPSYSLMHGQEVVENLKYLSIRHNINLMFLLRDEYSLDIILEAARSEKDWKNLREYIRIFEEYSTYLTGKQKEQTIKFLYENLTHSEDDIRRHCAELIGTLIAIYDEDYTKEIPSDVKLAKPTVTGLELLKEYIELLLYPGHKIITVHRFYLRYSLSFLVSSFFAHCKENQKNEYLNLLMDYYNERNAANPDVALCLLEVSKYVPYKSSDERILMRMYAFLLLMMKKRSSMLRLSAFESALFVIDNSDSFFLRKELARYLKINVKKSNIEVENRIKYNLCKKLSLRDTEKKYNLFLQEENVNIQEIFLSNLKTATDWIKKRQQVDMLLSFALESPETYGMHTVIHFCNLLKVSAVESVRNRAGSAILIIMPLLSPSERNEVAVELLRALEIEGHKFTEYIPRYLGKILLYLEPKELNEILDDLIIKIKSARPIVKTLILKTVGISIANYSQYQSEFNEDNDIFGHRLSLMLGILLNGMCDFNYQVKQAAFSVIGKEIFGSADLSLIQKEHIFSIIGKKVLTLITENKKEELLFLSNSAGLKHIYKFISDYTFEYKPIELDIPKVVAFFPGTFDPFSESHKEIARLIRDMGYEVFLAVDEFSWSKKTLPNLLRKNILNMSIASEYNMFVYPDSFPTNLSNNEDLKVLKNNFKDSKVYIVVGSDVLLNASSYNLPASENSVHSFSHIVFERNKSKKLEEAAQKIKGEIIYLSLSSKFSSISSTQIRNYIDENRDISSLVDPLAQQYIYENGFYQREPQEKSTVKSLWLKVDVRENISKGLIEELSYYLNADKKPFEKFMSTFNFKQSSRVIILRDERENNKILGFSLFHWIRSGDLYEELKDTRLCDYIRNKSLGRIILIDGLFVTIKDKTIEQTLITETLAFCISRDYEYAIFKPVLPSFSTAGLEENLRLQGFVNINLGSSNKVFAVDMSTPTVLNFDVDNILKEPFRSNQKVSAVVAASRKKLQEALINIYPGEALLCFDTNIMHQHMIRKICKENQVSTEIAFPRKLGPAMCVPYGDILDRNIIPNTVTKSLHTEKYYNPDMNSFRVAEFPHYLDLQNQIRMLQSFMRPIILVDNLLHKGYRMRALDPLLKEEMVKIQKIIVGILSGKGKDLMDIQKRDVESVYFIPRLKIWLNENALYPFIGGDALFRGSYTERNLLPSINLILPYTYPGFIKGADTSSVYNLSKVCIENAIAILSVLESEYHLIHERNLNLSNMGQVFTIPRCPDRGKDMLFDLNLSPSHYLYNDLETLLRYGIVMGPAHLGGN